MARTVAVLGGGIAGLTAAFELRRLGLKPLLFEAGDRLGGKILTTPFAGVALDAGPDAFLARVPWASELCHDLGVGDELVAPATSSAFVFSNGQLRRFPAHLMLGVPTDLDALRRSGLISAAGVERAAQDLIRPYDGPGTDESIGSLVRRRLGAEILDKLIDPLLSGIFAGDSDQLSVAAAAPQIAAAAAGGSLIAGARALLPVPSAGTGSATGAASGSAAPVFLTLPGGLGRLVDLLAQRIGADNIRLKSPVEGLQRSDRGWLVAVAGGRAVPVDAVVVTTPAPVSARLLAEACRSAAGVLGGIEYSSVVLTSFAWPSAALGRPLDGSGFLVPRSEGLLMTACSWSSAKFAHLGGDGVARLRVSAGRWGDDRIAGLSDTDLVDRLRADLAVTMGIEAPPVEVRISPWPNGLPQYWPGHLDRLAAAEAALADQAPGIVVTGAAFRGVGLPAGIHQARRAAEQIAATLAV